MYKLPVILIAAGLCLNACKSRNEAAATASAETAPTVLGTVSHKYAKDGCPVVVIVKTEAEEMTLVPKDPISKKLDVEGKQIRFSYRLLKMAQPAGCGGGIPAELTHISKK